MVASAPAPTDRFGSTLAISGDTLVVTTPSATVDGKLFAGAAYVFQRDAVTRAFTERRRLVAQDGAAFDQLGGSSVAIDGDTILLGASRARIGNVLQQGAVYVFERNAGGPDAWGQTAKLTDDSVGAIGNFGSSIAIEGSLLVIGASRGGTNGHVAIFERGRGGPGAWGKVTSLLDSVVGDGGTPLESFGNAVALDGDLLLVGASAADVSYFSEDDGAAYVFRRNASDRDRWDFVTRLTAPGATLCTGGRTLAEVSLDTLENQQAVERCAKDQGRTDRDAFGGAVAIDDDTIVIGAAGEEAASGPVVGAVHVFRRDATSDRWDHAVRLAGSDLLDSTSPGFGRTLAFRGDLVMVGAPGVDIATHTDQGAVYRFERDAGGPGAWGEVARLVAGDGVSGESFGAAVALDGLHAIIGASGYELGQGAVYLAEPARPEAPPEPAFPVTGELTADGVVTSAHGVLLGAAGSPLDAPLPIWIHEVPPPAEPVSFGTPRGAYYNVGAAESRMPAADAPFGLALPVPAGVDPARLAVAARFSTSHVADHTGVGASWFPLPGVYNPDSHLFSIALPALFIEGTTVVLVEDPAAVPSAPVAARRDDVPTPTFAITCVGFADPTDCRADAARMNGFLEASHAELLGLGYLKPRLAFFTQAVLVTEGGVTFEKVESAQYSTVTAVPTGSADCPAGRLAAYDARAQGIRMCYPGSAIPDADLRATLRHELFHAFQHGYVNFHKEWGAMSKLVPTDLENMQWIREGTAAASEESGTTMRRNLVQAPPLHPVTRALTAAGALTSVDFIAYAAQDFWVYVGKTASGLGLDYLRELFSRGLSPDAADAMLRDVHGTSLAREYWKWVKNQAIEKSPDLDGALTNPCSIEVPRDAAIVGALTPVSFPSPDGVRLLVGTLNRLTATVVMFKIATNVGRTRFTVTPVDPGIEFKVYVNDEAGCAGGSDGSRTVASLARDAVVYVIIANTNHKVGNRVSFAVSVAPAP